MVQQVEVKEEFQVCVKLIALLDVVVEQASME